jgi:hypothetical protein
VDPDHPEPPTKRVYVPIEDAKLKRLLEESEATGLTVEALIQRSVIEHLERLRREKQGGERG